MKLTPFSAENTKSGSRSGRVSKRRGAASAYGSSSSQSVGDSVELSAVASELAAALEASAQDDIPPADPMRLAAIRDSIHRGEYEFDRRALAEAILSDDVNPGI